MAWKRIRLSNENSNTVGKRFEPVLVIIGQPNLVSNYLKTLPRRELQKIPKISFLPPYKNIFFSKFRHFWRFFWYLLETIFNQHTAIPDTKAGNQTKSYHSGNILRPSWLKSVDYKYFLSFFKIVRFKWNTLYRVRKQQKVTFCSSKCYFQEIAGPWVLSPTQYVKF